MAIDGFLHAEDPLSTMSALNQIGASISLMKMIEFFCENKVFIIATLNLGNSGTGLVSARFKFRYRFTSFFLWR